MKLLLDEKTLRFVWGGSGEYWYSRVDSQVHSSVELECDDTEDLMTNGFIPFLTISNEEVIRAYIKFLDNKKVSAVLTNVKINSFLKRLRNGVSLILLNIQWKNNEKIVDNYGLSPSGRYMSGAYQSGS